MKTLNLTIFDQNIWGNCGKQNTVSNRNEAVRRLVAKHDADVCCFQECSPEKSRADGVDIARLMQDAYTEAVTPQGKQNYTPVFYKTERFTLIESGFHAYTGKNDVNSKSLTYALLEEKESKVRFAVISTHFWFKSIDESDNLQRLENVKELLSYIKMIEEKYAVPVFAMGDLNCGINSRQNIEPYYALKKELLDVRDIAAEGCDTLTYHAVPVLGEDGLYHSECPAPGKTLDHMFLNSDKGVCVDRFIVDDSMDAYVSSDHFPLVAMVNISEE